MTAAAEDWLARLERRLAEDPGTESLAVALVVLASVAGAGVELDEDEVAAASRRALLLLAAGGDPERGLDLRGRAVGALADELDDESRRAELVRGLERVRADATGLPHLSEALHELAREPDLAWRAYACSLLADLLGADE